MTRPPLFPTAPNSAVLGTGVVAFTRPAAPTLMPDLSFDYLADGTGTIGDIRVNMVVIEVPPGPPPAVLNVERHFEQDTENTMTLVTVVTTDLPTRVALNWWMGPTEATAVQTGSYTSSGYSRETTIRTPGLQAATYPTDWFLDTHIVVENSEGTDTDAGWTGVANMVQRPYDLSAAVAITTTSTIGVKLTATNEDVEHVRVDYGVVSGVWSGAAYPIDATPGLEHNVLATGLLADTVYYLRASAVSVTTGLRGYAQEGILSARTNTILSPVSITPFVLGARIDVELITAGVGVVEWGTDTTYADGSVGFSGVPGSNIVQIRGLLAATTYHVRVRLTGLTRDQDTTGPDSTFTTLAYNFVDWTVVPIPFNFQGDFMDWGAPTQSFMDDFGVVRCEAARFTDPTIERLFVRITFWPLMENQAAGTYRVTPCWKVTPLPAYTGHANDVMILEHIGPTQTMFVAWPNVPTEFPSTPGELAAPNTGMFEFTWDGNPYPEGFNPPQPYYTFRMYQDWPVTQGLPLEAVLYIKGVWLERIA